VGLGQTVAKSSPQTFERELGSSVSRAAAYIVGIHEYPARVIRDRSTPQLHAEAAAAALADAGLTIADVDGFGCTGDPLDPLSVSMADYLGLRNLAFIDTTGTGGSSPLVQLGHAVSAIAAGKCEVVLLTLAQRVRSGPVPPDRRHNPEFPFEGIYGLDTMPSYALAARRHMHEYGTTSEQLAWVKVASSQHAQHNPHAFLPDPVTVEQVLESPILCDPLHRMDCCVVTDAAGAAVLVSPRVVQDTSRAVAVLAQSEAAKHADAGRIDLTYTAARWTGPRAFQEAGCTPADIDYASIYDSFTITVVETLEDLGFCEKGMGGPFVADGGLLSPGGRLPVNTDGGGLSNNHPGRGGMMRLLEAVRQLRGEAHPALQVPNCHLALVHGTGGQIGTRMASATVILEAGIA
jgi:acetyl-CoA C-acetyltransferase